LRQGPASTVVSAPSRPSPRQLPPPVPNFIGRAAELQELAALLDAWTAARGTTMIAVISGAAGVGKTALGVYWAHQVAGSFPDGQLYLNLNGFGPTGSPVTQADAVTRILEAMQVPLARIPPGLDGRIGLYRTLLSERRTLIVLDNARDAEQVRPLLPGGAGSLVLVTSRSPLTGLVALEGARAITLTVLTEPEARQMVAQRLGIGRTAADGAATDQLIDACARLPLALAIAAALVATRPGQSLTTVASNLSRADNRLDVLNTGEATTNLRGLLLVISGIDGGGRSDVPPARRTSRARYFRHRGRRPGWVVINPSQPGAHRAHRFAPDKRGPPRPVRLS
jgi:NB-ARC domain